MMSRVGVDEIGPQAFDSWDSVDLAMATVYPYRRSCYGLHSEFIGSRDAASPPDVRKSSAFP